MIKVSVYKNKLVRQDGRQARLGPGTLVAHVGRNVVRDIPARLNVTVEDGAKGRIVYCPSGGSAYVEWSSGVTTEPMQEGFSVLRDLLGRRRVVLTRQLPTMWCVLLSEGNGPYHPGQIRQHPTEQAARASMEAGEQGVLS